MENNNELELIVEKWPADIKIKYYKNTGNREKIAEMVLPRIIDYIQKNDFMEAWLLAKRYDFQDMRDATKEKAFLQNLGDERVITIAEKEGFPEKRIVRAKRAHFDRVMKDGNMGIEHEYYLAKEYELKPEDKNMLERLISEKLQKVYDWGIDKAIAKTNLEPERVVSALRRGISEQEKKQKPNETFYVCLVLKKHPAFKGYYSALETDVLKVASRVLDKDLEELKCARGYSQIKIEQRVDDILDEFPGTAKNNVKKIKQLAEHKLNKEERFDKALYYAGLINDKEIVRKAAEKIGERHLQYCSFHEARMIHDKYPAAQPFIQKAYEKTFNRLADGKDKDIRKAIDLAIAFKDKRYETLIELKLKEDLTRGNLSEAICAVDSYDQLKSYKDIVHRLYKIMEKND